MTELFRAPRGQAFSLIYFPPVNGPPRSHTEVAHSVVGRKEWEVALGCLGMVSGPC